MNAWALSDRSHPGAGVRAEGVLTGRRKQASKALRRGRLMWWTPQLLNVIALPYPLLCAWCH